MSLRSFILCASTSLFLFLSGCAAPSLMSQSNERAKSAPNGSVVTFYRTPNIFAAFERPILVEKTNSDLILIGTLDADTKIQYPTTPRKHYFRIITKEYIHIMSANLDAGKSYYSHTVPWFGILHYNLKLIHEREEESLNTIAMTSTIKNNSVTTDGEKWFNKNKQKFISALDSALSNFDEVEEYTLFPEDGHPFSMDPNIVVVK